MFINYRFKNTTRNRIQPVQDAMALGVDMQFNAFIEWAFLGLVGSGVVILWQMKESMATLNSKIEILIVKHESARKDIDDHEDRIRNLEGV